jgi:outer membrane lipoprotein-sorting protein
MSRLRWYAIIALFFAELPLSGCLFRSHVVERPFTGHLQTATQSQLIAYLEDQAQRIHSMQATVDIDTSVGGEKKGKVTDYKEIRGYILVRKPAMLRMIGLLPVVRTRAFDMVSDGQNFKLSIPPKNRFVVGSNDVILPNPQQPLENLRPQVIYNAVLIQPVDQQNEIAVLENDQQIVSDGKGHKLEQADYALDVIRKSGSGWRLARKIIFTRTDLSPHRQITYNESGDVVTNTLYANYLDYNGISYPTQIEIVRPQEEYDITLNMVKVEFNKTLTDEQFTLEQPPGAQVVHLGQPQAGSATAVAGANRP